MRARVPHQSAHLSHKALEAANREAVADNHLKCLRLILRAARMLKRHLESLPEGTTP